VEERSGGFVRQEAAERESALIDAYGSRIAGFARFPEMAFVGLAWASSAGPDALPRVEYIDALYLEPSASLRHADVAVRTWLCEPLARQEFSADPHIGNHLRDFMLERKGGDFDFEYGVSEIANALRKPARQPGTVTVQDIVAEQHRFDDIVTVVGYSAYLAHAPDLTVGLADIPRIRE